MNGERRGGHRSTGYEAAYALRLGDAPDSG